ncbi:hypothetical protein IFM89_039422 [Coptis chinensis]|uniref:WRKY domain-containing protein n=1 Tax=Coptis chinensis TaxID=261450 RepID=A0A835M3R2_9MAGN|nr:hypothetical protein IFM89_039422 [Coptis chinensis]
MEEDWDLQAVVRGCCSSSSSSSNSSNSTATASVLPVEDSFACFPSLGFPENENFFSFPDLFETKTVLDEFEQLYKPFLPKFQPPLFPPSPLNNPNPISFQQQQLLLQQQQHRVSVRMKQEQQQPRRTIAASTTISTPRQKRRKNQQKKVVCQVPAEGLSSDMWAWRKYGQNPSKGLHTQGVIIDVAVPRDV